MALKRSIAALIWAAILAVAVQLVPGTALAHGSHTPVAVAHAASAGHDAHRPAVARTHAPAQAVVSAAAHEHAPAPTKPGNCTGGCCSNGTSCCGGLLSVDTTSMLRDVPMPERVFSHTAPPSGLAPDELIRPPRILA